MRIRKDVETPHEKYQDSALVVGMLVLGFILLVTFHSIYFAANDREIFFLWGVSFILLGFGVLILKSAFFPPIIIRRLPKEAGHKQAQLSGAAGDIDPISDQGGRMH